MIIWWIRLVRWVGAVVEEMIGRYLMTVQSTTLSVQWCQAIRFGKSCHLFLDVGRLEDDMWEVSHVFEYTFWTTNTRFFIFFTVSMNLGWVLCDDGSVLESTKSVSQKQRLSKLCQNFAFAWNRENRMTQQSTTEGSPPLQWYSPSILFSVADWHVWWMGKSAWRWRRLTMFACTCKRRS